MQAFSFCLWTFVPLIFPITFPILLYEDEVKFFRDSLNLYEAVVGIFPTRRSDGHQKRVGFFPTFRGVNVGNLPTCPKPL
jgi:hypothetical protein